MSKTCNKKHQSHRDCGVPKYIFAVHGPGSIPPRKSITVSEDDDSDLQRWWNDDSASTTLIDDEDLSSCSSSPSFTSEDENADDAREHSSDDPVVGFNHCRRCASSGERIAASVDSALPPAAPKRIPSSKTIGSSSTMESSLLATTEGSTEAVRRRPLLDKSAQSADIERRKVLRSGRRQNAANLRRCVTDDRVACRKNNSPRAPSKRQSLPPKLPQRKGSNVSSLSMLS